MNTETTTEPLRLRRISETEFASRTGTVRIVQTGYREWHVMTPAGETISHHFTSPRQAAMSINAEFEAPGMSDDIRAGDIEWLTGALETLWNEARDNIKHPLDVMASDILCCLDGYEAPPSDRDPGAATRGPTRIKLS